MTIDEKVRYGMFAAAAASLALASLGGLHAIPLQFAGTLGSD